MKAQLLVILAGVVASFSSFAFAALERKEDRFSGSITWSAKVELAERHSDFMWVADSAQLTAVVNRDGSSRASLMIMTNNGTGGRSPGWRYLGVNRVLWLADGQPLDLATSAPVRTAQRGYVVEVFIQPLTVDELQRIAESQIVEFKIGSDEFRLPTALQDAAREAVIHLQAEVSAVDSKQPDDAQ